jgi:hypothetical protein
LETPAQRSPKVFGIRDKVTGDQRTVRSVILGVEVGDSSTCPDRVLKDCELLEKLNGLVGARGFRGKNSLLPPETAPVERALDRGVSLVQQKGSELGVPFRFPEAEQLRSCGQLCQVLRNKGRKTKGATSMMARLNVLARSVGEAKPSDRHSPDRKRSPLCCR